MMRTTPHAWLGLAVGFALMWPSAAAEAQEPPPADAASTQPAQHPESQQALEKLLKMRDELKRQQEEKDKEKAQQPTSSGENEKDGNRARSGRRQTTSRPVVPQKENEGLGDKNARLRELQQRARASTQRAGNGQGATPAEGTPPDVEQPPTAPPVTPPGANPPVLAPGSPPVSKPPAPTPQGEELIGPPLELSNSAPAAPPPAAPPAQAAQAAPSAPKEPQPAPPTEPTVRQRRSGLPDDGEWFNFRDTPWEEVIAIFAERLGKPLLATEDTVIGGALTYVNDRKFTKEEALDELNLIMHEKGYRFVEEEHHIRIIPVNELRQWVSVTQTFDSVEAFEAAQPRDMDFVVVYWQVRERPARSYVEMFADALPDSALLSDLGDSNQVKLVALARDVRRFLLLKDKVKFEPSDPRVLKIFDIKTNAMDIEQRVRSFLRIGGAGAQPTAPKIVRDPRTGQMIPQPAPAAPTTPEAGDVLMVADERTNSIIVKATEEKIAEIADLIEKLDQKPDIGEFKTEVIPVEHGDAAQIATLLNEVFRQEQGQTAGQSPVWQQQQQVLQQQMLQRARRGAQPGQPQPPQPVPVQVGTAPESIIVEGVFERAKKTIRLVAEPRMNALIVYANAEGMERVRKMLSELDKEHPDNLREFKLENAMVADIAPLLTQLVAEISQAAKTGGARGEASVVPDEANNLFYVIAERDLMDRVAELIARLDVSSAERQRHVIELKRLRPSDVASMVQTLLGGGSAARRATGAGAAVRSRLPGGSPVMPPSVPPASGGASAETYQVIALDEAQLLIVLCSDRDWQKIEETIRMWDERALTNTPRLESFTIAEGSPAAIAATLQNFYRSYQHPVLGTSPVTIQPEGDKIYVYAIEPAIEEIAALIETLDVEAVTSKVEILMLVNADASQVATQVTQLLAKSGPKAAGAAGPLVLAEPAINALLVQGDRADVDKIKGFVREIDLCIGAQATEQRFYTMRFVQPNEMATAIQNIFGAQKAGKAGATVAQVRAMAAGAQLIVEAPKEKFTAIEAFIKQMDDPKGNELVFKTIKLTGRDVTTAATTLATTLRGLVRPGAPQPTFTPDVASESILAVATADLWPKIDELVATFQEGAEELLPVTIPLKHQTPDQVANVINQFFGAGRPGGGQGRQQEVQAQAAGGQLVVKATKKRLEEVKKLVEELDAADPAGLQVKTYTLRVLNATTVATQVQTYLRSILPTQRTGQMQPGAFGEPTTNSLVVIAPPEQLPFIDALVTQFENAERPESGAKTYVLKNARAEQISQNLDTMLKAKVAEREGGVRKTLIQTGVYPDQAGNRLIVFAPEEYQELAGKLVQMLDEEVTVGDVVHILALENGDAQQVAASVDKVIQGNRTGSGTPGARSGTSTVRVSADVGSNSIILAGLAKDLAEVEKWLKDLDINSTRVPELQVFRLQHANTKRVVDTAKAVYGGSKTPQDQVTITADEYSGEIIVTANKRKMRQVEAFIQQLDAPPAEGAEGTLPGGRQLYFVDLQKGKGSDIAWSVGDLLPDPDDGGPSIDYDIWDDTYLIVKCRPSEFPMVEKLIRDFDARAKLDRKVVVRKLRGDPTQLVPYIQARQGDEVVIEQAKVGKEKLKTLVIDVWPEGEEPPARKEKREKSDRPEPEKQRLEKPASPGAANVGPRRLLDEIERELAGEPVASGAWMPRASMTVKSVAFDEPPAARPAGASRPTPAADKPAATSAPAEREKARIVLQPDGTVVIEGPKDQVDDIEDAIDLLEEDLTVGEVIRIFRFKYGDVSAAAEVLSAMFDVQQRQIVIQPPQQPQQRPGQQGRPGEEGRGPQGGGLMDQFRTMVGGQQQEAGKKGGGSRMRIIPDPGHNYLIVKCDEADLPDIIQLLRELDIPPGEVQIKIFQLKNLLAEETAENIRDVLGISKVQQKRGTRQPPMPGRPGQPGQQQQQLFEMLQQQLVSVPGVEGGAKVERVEIIPNGVTNSLLVSAPPEVMGLIERVIRDLEQLEGRDVVGIYYYPLTKARVDDILPLLQEVFSTATGGSAGGGPSVPRGLRGLTGGGGGGASPASLGPVTISADPRSNTIIFSAQSKDRETVEKHIQALDIDGAVAEAEMYVCRYGDAEAIASAVEALFAGGGGAARPGVPGAPRSGGASDVRIVPEAATNTILVWAPADKRDLIFDKIEALDKLTQHEIREIAIRYADPEKLASTLSEIFASGTGATPGGRARRPRQPGGAAGAPGAGPNVTNSGRIMILGDKPAKKLLVRAPNEIFAQIEELVLTLDHPSSQMQLKRFQLKHADATGVVDSVKQAMADYVLTAKTTGTETDFDAFTAVPDARTNSVMVVGSERTFAFVQQVLAAVDVETPKDQRKEFRVFMLEKANAAIVAEAINGFATGGAAGGQAGGKRPGGAGAAAGAPRELIVFAVAEEPTNSVMVFGKAEDIDVVEEAVIARLEDSLADRTRIETVAVNNVPPSQIVSFISMFMGETGRTGGQPGRPGQRPAGEQTTGPQMVPNDSAKTLVVRGTRRQIEEVRDLVTRFDDPDIVQHTVKVVEIPRGQDSARLAADIEQIVNQNEQDLADRSGRQPRKVVLRGDQYTNSIIAAGDPALFGQVESIVKQLGEVRSDQYVTTIIELKNLSAQDAEDVINQLQKKGTGGRGGGGGVRPAGGSSGGSKPSAPRPSGGSAAPSKPPASPPPAPAPAKPSTPAPRKPSGTPAPGGGKPAPAPGGGGGKRSSLAPQMDQPWTIKPVAWVGPYVTATPLSPFVALMLGEAVLADDPPATTQPSRERRRANADQESPAAPTTRDAARMPTVRDQALREIEKDLLSKTPKPETTPPPAIKAVSEEGEEPTTEPADLPRESLSGITGSLKGEVTAKALDSQRIVVEGDERDVAFIESVLRMMERTTSPALIEVFTLKKSKATALQPIIEKAVKAWIDARTKTPGPQDKFSINAEGRSNALIVSASTQLMEVIRDLVDRLDVDTPETDARTLVLEHIRAAEAVSILKPTVEKLNKLRAVPTESQAAIEAIDRNNSVMIIGTPADIEEIEKWFEAIDVEITAEQKQKSFVRAEAILIQLKNAQAEDVAKVINDMIKAELETASQAGGGDRKTAGKPIVKTIKLHMPDGTELPELELDYPIRLIHEKGTNSLIIFSTPDNNTALEAIVGLFDTLPVGADTDVKAFALRHAAAEEVSKLLTDLFKDKTYLNRPSEGEGKGLEKGKLPPVPPGLAAKGLPYPLVVQSDARSNTVLVVGRKDAVLLAGGLISELDRPTVELGLKPYVLPLKSAQAAQLTDKLKKLWEDRTKALHGDKNTARDSALFHADERSNKLIVLASDDVYDMVEELVLQLDASDKYSVVDLRYRALAHADAVKLKNLLEETFKSKKDAEKASNKDAADTLSVLADTRSNSLLLTGTRDYLDEAERLVARLDQKFDPTVEFKARKVKLNSAPNVASLLKEMVEKALATKDSKLSGTPIHVSADPVSDSLLIAAAREDLELVERWVDILDRPSEVGRMTRIIPLARATADTVTKAVQDIFKSKGGGAGKGGELDVAVSADKTTNSVVAFGPPALVKDVEDFVRQLDATTATKSTIVRIFKLEQASAQDAGELLNRILELRGGSVGGTRGGGGGGATSGGAKDEEKQILLVFQRQHPDLGLETLMAIRKDVTVISDVRTNALVVTAPADSMALMEELVKTVDVPPQDAKIRVFRLRNSDAEQMVKTLETLFERKTTGRQGGGGTGTGDQPERVLTLGEGLGGEGGRQEIAFTTDVRTNSVIAAGTSGYLDLAEQTIMELDTVPLTDRVTFVYAPRNIKAKSLVPSLKDFSDAEQNRLKDIGKDVSIGAKQERQIVAIANEDANRVILSVDPRFQESVMDVVKQLDQPPPQVLIQVLIVEVTMSNSLDLGVEFAFQDLQYAKAGVGDTTTFDFVGGTDIGAAGSGLGGFSFTITGADFNFLFRTLQTENNLQVLSRPQIVAQDNQKAVLEIGDDVPYISGTATTTGGVTSVNVAREKVGIKLEVTPQINPDGYVRMEIKQEVSDITGSTVAVGQGVTAPVFFRRNANTTLTVKDNETVLLGGLITSRTENKETKVPIVGDIPGLGLLFRNQNDNTKRTELLVVLTPHVVRTVEEFQELSLAQRDATKLVPDEILTDPLLQGLRVEPSATPELEGEMAEPAVRDAVRREEPGVDEDEYGPIRPTLRVEPKREADPDSYDVPVTLRSARR